MHEPIGFEYFKTFQYFWKLEYLELFNYIFRKFIDILKKYENKISILIGSHIHIGAIKII